MRIAARLSLAALAAGALLSAGLPWAPPAAAEDAIDTVVNDFHEYLKTNPDSQGLRNKIAEISLKKDPRIADALLPILRNPKYDDDTRVAVAQNIGKQGKKGLDGMLVSMAEDKKIEEKPKLLAALMEGIGDSNPKGQSKFLMDTAKKYLDLNADVACAAYRGASNHVTGDLVDFLIAELGRADYTTQQDNPVKRAARNASKPVLIDLLKKTTGKDCDVVKVWVKWWSKAKKTWKAPDPNSKEKPKDINASETFVEDLYGFEIKKPSRAWSFRKPGGSNPYLSLEAMDEGSRAAWAELYIVGVGNYKDKTPEQWAESFKGQFEAKFRDIKNADWAKKCTYGGLKGVEQIVTGQHKDHDAIYMHNVFMDDSEIMYYFLCIWKSGKPQALKDDIAEIIKSFKLK